MKSVPQLIEYFGRQPLKQIPLTWEEMEFIQKDAMGIASRSGCLLAELEEEKKKTELLVNCLIGIVNSAAHPEIAIRVISLDLNPIRKTLKDCGVVAPTLGIK